MIVADDPLSEDYPVLATRAPFAYALALVITKGEDYTLSLETTSARPSENPNDTTVEPYWSSLEWVRFLLSDGRQHTQQYIGRKLALAEKRMKTLDYFRRFFATLFGFILFGVAGVLFKIALLPYTLKSTKGDIKRQLEARRMIGKVWRFFVGYLQWSGVLSVRFNGLENSANPASSSLPTIPRFWMLFY